MVLTIRKADERGHANHGWLDSHHTFSFADYYDPAHMGFRGLRVINDDRIAGGGGFGTHPHRDMEIVTYVLEGAIEHKDSMGNGSIIRAGDVQRMSAGTGVRHSERNPSNQPVHMLQIWILPMTEGSPPGYEQKTFREEDKRAKLCLVASTDGASGSVTIHADARIYATVLYPGDKTNCLVPAGRYAWVHVASGSARVGEVNLVAGDGASMGGMGVLPLEGVERAEVLVFDLA